MSNLTQTGSAYIPSLDPLVEAYKERDRAAMKWKEKQGKVIGWLGSEVPEELLIAAGFLPIRIAGNKTTDPKVAKEYLESGFDPLVHAQVARLVEGSYSYLDHFIISNSSDALIRVYYYMRALHRVNPSISFPNPYFHDFLHTKFHSSGLYNRDRTYDLIRQIETWSGEPLDMNKVREAINLCNETRQLLRKLDALRGPDDSRVSGVQALQVIGASMFMDKAEFNQLLREFLDEAENLPKIAGVRLFVTGSPHDDTEFYQLVESLNAVIVGEDHETGSRYYVDAVDTTVDPVDGIVDRYHYRFAPSSQSTVSERVESLVSNVSKCRAQGVICFIHQSDDAPSWDFPEQKNALEKMDIPVLLIDNQAYRLDNKEQIHAKVSRFVDQIDRM